MVARSVDVRFWEKVSRSSKCWEWTASKDSCGYGLFRVSHTENMRRAHRVAWTLENGEIPDGLHVLHRCDNPACVRPSHLFLGTHRDNMLDMHAKGRGRGFPTGDRNPSRAAPEKFRGGNHWLRRHKDRTLDGEANPNHRLTADDVAAIRRRYAGGGVRQVDLAREYGVTQPNISAIVRGATWGA